MTFPFSADTLVKDIVNEIPKSSDVFKKYRIDFCCGGNIPLSQAVKQNGLEMDSLMEELKLVFEKNHTTETNLTVWTNSDSNTLIEHVISEYHRSTQEELAMLSPYVTKVARVHGDRHPELLKVNELFNEFKQEMIEHMEKEEAVVFPAIKQLDDKTIKNPESAIEMIKEIEQEHDRAGDILKEIRKITFDFLLPIDACGTYHLVFNRLEELEGLTFMHVHLENNILFPRYL